MALGALHSPLEQKIHLSLEGMDSATPDLMATSVTGVLMGEVMLEYAPNIVQVSHLPSPPTMYQKLWDVASISPSPQSQSLQG